MYEIVELAEKANRLLVTISTLSVELSKVMSAISKASGEDEYVFARQCPDCACDSYVIESREAPDGSIYRRRECLMCKKRFVTREIFDHMIESDATVHKRRKRKKELEK